MKEQQEKVKKLISELKEDIPDNNLCSTLDECLSSYQKVMQNINSPIFNSFLEVLKPEVGNLKTVYANIDQKSLLTQNISIFESILKNLSNELFFLQDKIYWPLRESEKYTETLDSMNAFCKSFEKELKNKKSNSNIFKLTSEFETKYFGVYVLSLSKTRADKSHLSSISVAVGDICTRMRNISECKDHQQEIDDLINLLNVESKFISLEDLKRTLIEVSQNLNRISVENDSPLANEIKAQSDLIKQLANREIINKNTANRIDLDFSDSDDEYYEEPKPKRLIDRDPKNFLLRDDIEEPKQRRFIERDLAKSLKDIEDDSDYDDDDDNIQQPEPLFHPKLLSQTPPVKSRMNRSRPSLSPQLINRKRFSTEGSKTERASSVSKIPRRQTKTKNKYDYLVSSYAQKRRRI